MTSAKWTVLMVAVAAAAVSAQTARTPAAAQDLTGTWKLNRELSQFPEVGFGMDAIPSGESAAGQAVNPQMIGSGRQSEAESRNMRQLVDEVRNPPAFLKVVQTADAVTVTDERARTRTFHLVGRDEPQRFDAGPMVSTTRWEGNRLVIRYKVAPSREVRYSLWLRTEPSQLVVQTELVERGGRDTVIRVYEPALPGEFPPPAPTTPPPASTPSGLRTLPAQPGAGAPGAQGAPAASGTIPADKQVPAAGGAGTPFDQRPDAEFKGLTTLGVVVEDVGTQAAACGVRREAIETAVSKPLADAGLKIVHNADEDTYLYVNVITASTSAGYCFSRYDAHLYTHTTAQLSYGASPVLVQVLLLHKGGISGSGAAGHGDAVAKSLGDYVAQFAARIREANK